MKRVSAYGRAYRVVDPKRGIYRHQSLLATLLLVALNKATLLKYVFTQKPIGINTYAA
jgi:hypothetical protein